jgi:hypothetical protein
VLLRGGGFLDSMIENVTGTFAEAPTQEAFIEALERLPGSYDTEAIVRHSGNYTAAAFQRVMRDLVMDMSAPVTDGLRAPRPRAVGSRPGARSQPET